MTPREAELTRQLEAALSALSGMEALRRENQCKRHPEHHYRGMR